MAFLKWPDKDPNEVLDYVMDWSARLADDDEITASSWTIAPVTASPLTADSNSFTASSATIWLSGGLLGTKYTLTNRVVTDDGRTMDQSVTLKIKAR